MMSPLEAAKRLAGQAPFHWDAEADEWLCLFCGIALMVDDRPSDEDFAAAAAAYDAHANGCMWRAMPQIVAALEAAERFSRAYDAREAFGDTDYEPADPGDYWDRDDDTQTELEDAHVALVAALKGETP